MPVKSAAAPPAKKAPLSPYLPWPKRPPAAARSAQIVAACRRHAGGDQRHRAGQKGRQGCCRWRSRSPPPEEQKEKVVRDGFSMPRTDYEKFRTLKAVCLAGGLAVKKSELLRAGLHALEALPIPDLLARIQALPPIKAGRKKK